MSAEPTRLQDAIRLANSLMDQKLKGYATRSAENKRKFESNQRDNHAQQPPFKRQNVGGSNVARAYTASVPLAVNQRAPMVNQRSATCFQLSFPVYVMAASVIPISSNSSEESVGSHVSRVILFGSILAIILVIHVIPSEVPIVPADPLVVPEVGIIYVTSPPRVLDLVDYSSSYSDSSEVSLPPALELPLVSSFLCSDDSKADSESEPAEQRPKRHKSLAAHDVMVSRWRGMVASRPSLPSGSSSHDTFIPSSEFPIVLVVAPLEIHRRPAILIRPEEAIPFGRPYHTHLNWPCKLLTARKRVGPFPARRLAWRCVSHCSSDRHSLPDFTSDSSSSGSSSDSSSYTSSGLPSDSLSNTSSVHSSGCDASG
ncbi:hypothetical protein Tco_0542885 [Tanacetum coccineum]